MPDDFVVPPALEPGDKIAVVAPSSGISGQLERYNPNSPVVFDLDFGHTTPTAPLPVGERVVVDPTTERITFE